MSDQSVESADDEEMLRRYSAELATLVERSLVHWVVEQVVQFWPDSPPPEILAEANRAGEAAAAEVGGKVRSLLELDIDEQWTNPLALIRTAVAYPTDVLRAAGLPPVDRDQSAKQFHPADVYDLTPGGFAVLGPEVGEAGLRWGAAKAHVHLKRRAAKGG